MLMSPNIQGDQLCDPATVLTPDCLQLSHWSSLPTSTEYSPIRLLFHLSFLCCLGGHVHGGTSIVHIRVQGEPSMHRGKILGL